MSSEQRTALRVCSGLVCVLNGVHVYCTCVCMFYGVDLCFVHVHVYSMVLTCVNTDARMSKSKNNTRDARRTQDTDTYAYTASRTPRPNTIHHLALYTHRARFEGLAVELILQQRKTNHDPSQRNHHVVAHVQLRLAQARVRCVFTSAHVFLYVPIHMYLKIYTQIYMFRWSCGKEHRKTSHDKNAALECVQLWKAAARSLPSHTYALTIHRKSVIYLWQCRMPVEPLQPQIQ